jgi:hypothetical protein
MSNIKHRIWVGSPTVIDIDGVYNPPQLEGFTFDRTTIKMDSTIRTFDEHVI